MEWKLFADLAEVAGEKRVSVPLESATVSEALEALLEAHPVLRERVLDADGELVDHINILVNGEDVFGGRNGLATEVDADDELAMFPPVSGG